MVDDRSPSNELEDSTDARRGYDWGRLDPARLLKPDVLGRTIGVVVACMIVIWPRRTDAVLGVLVGIGLIGYALLSLWSAARDRSMTVTTVSLSLAALSVGLIVVTPPVESQVTFGRLLGAALIVGGLIKLSGLLRRDVADRGWRLTSGLSLVSIGVLLGAYPTEMLATITVMLAVAWAVLEILAISVLLDPDRDADAKRASTSELVAEWFERRPKKVEDRRRLYDELLYEGPDTRTKVIRFIVLMAFASVIAATGVVADSTAVVVGAMLIAPLMTPLMGMALSLVMGWPNRLARSSLVALVGIAIAIFIGFVVGRAEFAIIDTLLNQQIVSRSNPTINDLVIAIAAGAAGAYGWSRPDVSNALPGVAISIALVPPLTVIGISYSQRDWASGNGALLLFATNATAILIVGAAVFLLTGVAPLERMTENQYRVRTALAAVGVAAAVITSAVVLNGLSVATNLFEQKAASRVVGDWLERFEDHTSIAVTVEGDEVSVVLAGPALAEPPSADGLAADLSEELGRDIDVELRIRIETREVSGG